MTSVRIPLLVRPLCGSVADTPIPMARRLAWFVVAGLAVLGLWLHWSGWAIAAAVLILPDVPLLLPGAWADRARLQRWAVPLYNATHLAALPVLLALMALLADSLDIAGASVVVAFAAGWLCHIAVDRVAGYDLRDETGRVRISGTPA